MNKVNYNLTFYSDGFFGYGRANEFKNGSLAHLAPIILTIIIIFLIRKYKDKLKNFKYEEELRYVLAYSILFFEMAYYWRLLYVGPTSQVDADSFMTRLPLQVCEWTAILTTITILKKSKKLFSTVFTLTMSTSILALILPDTVLYDSGPAYFRYYQYFALHLLPIIAVYYMMFVHDFKPNKKGILYSWLFLTILYIAACFANNFLASISNDKVYLYIYILEKLPLPAFMQNYVCYYIVLVIIYLLVTNLVHLIFRKIFNLY